MQNQSQISQRTSYLLGLELANLEQHLSTIHFTNRDYYQTIIEIVGLYRQIKRQLDEAQSNANRLTGQLNDAQSYEILQEQLTMLNQMINNPIQSQMINAVLTKLNEYKNKMDSLLKAEKDNKEKLVMKLIQTPEIPEKILPDGLEHSQIFADIESKWGEVYNSAQQLEQKLGKIISSKHQNDLNFLNSQSDSISLRTTQLEELKIDLNDVKDKARIVKQYIESQTNNQNQKDRQMLSKVGRLITTHEQTIGKSLKLIEELINELKNQDQKTEAIRKENIELQSSIKKITQDHNIRLEQLKQSFNKVKEILDKKLCHSQIKQQYQSIKSLSGNIYGYIETSLKMHQKFYEKIEKKLCDVAASFIHISIRNITGSFLSRNDTQSLENKQEALDEIERFSKQIKNNQTNDINQLIENAGTFFKVFEKFFHSAGQDSKSKCFKQSFSHSQRAIVQLTEYLTSIQKGVTEFKKDHQELEELESKNRK